MPTDDVFRAQYRPLFSVFEAADRAVRAALAPWRAPRRTMVLSALICAGPASAPGQEGDQTAPERGRELLATSPAQSAPTSQPSDEVGGAAEPFDLLTTERLTGNWACARPWLEEKGFTFEMSLTTYFQQVARGGLNTRNAHNVIGSNDIELTFDLTKMGLIPGGTVYVWAANSWGESPTTRGWVGDLFYVNGGEVGNRPIDVLELWYEQVLIDDRLRIRVGKIGLSSSFDYNDFAWDPTTQFLNYGLQNAPNIPFPANAFGALGAQILITPCKWFYVGAGVADADADFNETGFDTTFHGPADFLSMYEFGVTPTFDTVLGKLPGHYHFGLWYDPRPKEVYYDTLNGRRATAPSKRDDLGFYVNFDQLCFHEKPNENENAEGLGAFLRYSYAPGDANLIENFWSVGAQYRGLLPTRDDDVFAVGVAQGILSKESRLAGFDPHQETGIETYYSIQLLPWLTLTPDMQWILRPGGEDGRDALVIGLRMQATF